MSALWTAIGFTFLAHGIVLLDPANVADAGIIGIGLISVGSLILGAQFAKGSER